MSIPDKGFVEAIAKLGVDANRPDTLVAGESGEYFFLLDRTTNTYVPKIRRNHVSHTLKSIPSLSDFATRCGPCELWYDRYGIELRYTRRQELLPLSDMAVLGMNFSEPFLVLMNGRQRHEHHAFVTLLRTKFRGCVNPANFAASIEGISFEASEKGKSVSGQTSRSVGREIESKIATHASALPESIHFTVPIWVDGGPEVTALRARIDCVLEADGPSQTFTITPFEGQIEDQIAAGERKIGELLLAALGKSFKGVESGIPPVYFGSP